jgi:FkbM family methyltransferase
MTLMNKLRILLRMLFLCRPPWAPIGDRLGLLKRGARHRVRYCRATFEARTGVGDFAVLNEIFLHQSYRLALRSIKTGSSVIDVGGNIGGFSIASAMAGAGEVHVFEPLPENFAMLQENIRLNGLEKVVRPILAAVADQPGVAVFNYKEGEAGAGTFFPSVHSAWKKEGGEPIRRIDVRCTTLRAFFEQRPGVACDLLKLDCEGGELQIISSLGKDADKVRSIVFEFHSDNNLDRILDMLREYGFSRFQSKRPYQVVFATRA